MGGRAALRRALAPYRRFAPDALPRRCRFLARPPVVAPDALHFRRIRASAARPSLPLTSPTPFPFSVRALRERGAATSPHYEGPRPPWCRSDLIRRAPTAGSRSGNRGDGRRSSPRPTRMECEALPTHGCGTAPPPTNVKDAAACPEGGSDAASKKEEGSNNRTRKKKAAASQPLESGAMRR